MAGNFDVISPSVGDNRELADSLEYLQNAIGAVAGPFDSYLALRGVKTLALRMKQHNSSAGAIAEWLSSHSEIAQVVYPGLTSHPQHKLASSQMDGFGGMISIFLDGDQFINIITNLISKHLSHIKTR